MNCPGISWTSGFDIKFGEVIKNFLRVFFHPSKTLENAGSDFAEAPWQLATELADFAPELVLHEAVLAGVRFGKRSSSSWPVSSFPVS